MTPTNNHAGANRVHGSRSDGLLRLLRTTVSLPLFDLNFLVASEQVDLVSRNPRFRRYGVLGCAAVFGLKLVRSALTWRPVLRTRIPQHAILACAETRNQFDAMAPIVKRLSDAIHVNLEAQPGIAFPAAAAYLVAAAMWPLPLARYVRATAYQRQTYRYVFHHYWLTFGWYLVSRLWLRRVRPSLVFFANDHNMKTRTLARAARAEGVPTAYVQHASVSEAFPPLGFDLAFLDGRDALEKYGAAGASSGRAFLAGIPKYDDFAGNASCAPRVTRVGICTNALDPEEPVVALCGALRTHLPELQVILRPHPGDGRPWHDLLSTSAVAISDSRREVSFAFLGRVDAVIVGDTGMALEALLMNVPPIRVDLAGTGSDNYGFVRRGVVPLATTTESLLSMLGAMHVQKPDVRHRASWYCATVGTAHDGHSTELVTGVVRSYLRATETGEIEDWQPPDAWRQLKQPSNVEAYDITDA